MYESQVQAYCQAMGPDVLQVAQQSLKTIIELIQSEAMVVW